MNDLDNTFLVSSVFFCSTTSCCFSSGIPLKIVSFYLEASCLCWCVHSRKRKLAVFFPPSVCVQKAEKTLPVLPFSDHML